MHPTPTQIATLLASTGLPAHVALLGIHPVLCTLLGTSSPREVMALLKNMPTPVGAILCDTLEGCISAAAYPHAQTVWQFNDPHAETFVLRRAFDERHTKAARDEALADVLGFIETHAETYPYVDILNTENALEFYCTDLQSPDVESDVAPDVEPPLADLARENAPAPPSAFWIPALAAGSLLIASFVAKDK